MAKMIAINGYNLGYLHMRKHKQRSAEVIKLDRINATIANYDNTSTWFADGIPEIRQEIDDELATKLSILVDTVVSCVGKPTREVQDMIYSHYLQGITSELQSDIKCALKQDFERVCKEVGGIAIELAKLHATFRKFNVKKLNFMSLLEPAMDVWLNRT
jgi:hypothetical protein